MTEQRSDRRHHPRKKPKIHAAGEVDGKETARVLDLSLGGARLELGTTLRPGGNCFLRLRLGAQPLQLTCRIVWCNIVGRGDADGAVSFQSGVAFEQVSQEARDLLTAFLDSQDASRGLVEWRDANAAGQ